MAPQEPVTNEETLESVKERLWSSLPSIAKLRAEVIATATAGNINNNNNNDNMMSGVDGNGKEKTTVADPSTAVRAASVPYVEMRQLLECLFMACHTNPVESDVKGGVDLMLDTPKQQEEEEEEEEKEQTVLSEEMKNKENTLYTWDDFIHFLTSVESLWLDWPDEDEKWLGVSEKLHISVLKELTECVTQDMDPFLLLAPQQVLTLQSEVAHAKTLVTPFEFFLDFVKPSEYPEIYNTLWTLFTQNEEKGTCQENLSLEKFTIFFKWFYLQVFANTTEMATEVVAKTMWLEHLNAHGVMTKKQFVEICRYMCRLYCLEKDDVKCLENFYNTSKNSHLQISEETLTAEHLLLECNTSSATRILDDPNNLYVPEELDEVKQEMQLYARDANANRIIIYGKRGIGKTSLAKALANHLNCVHLSVEDLAMEAVAKANTFEDSLGTQIIDCIDNNTTIPLSILMALVRKKINMDETLYRGYVFSDLPLFSGEENSDAIEFLNGCGIMDSFIPSTLVHLNCDDHFHQERLSVTLEERNVFYQRELDLRRAAEEDASHHQTLTDRVKHLQAIIKEYTEMSTAAAAADPNSVETETLEAAKAAAAEAETELPNALEEEAKNAEKISQKSADRTREIRELALVRMIQQSLSPDEKGNDTISIIDLPCFQSILERLQSLERCLTVGCTSLIEDSVTYIVNTLRLQPCILPNDLAEKLLQQEQEQQQQQQLGGNETGANMERDLGIARSVEDTATEMGVIPSTRWKRFCPVTFSESGVLVEGTARFGCVYRQRLYYLASEEKLQKFKANPLPYIRSIPLDGKPILLLSTIEKKDEEQFPSSNVQELIQILHEKLQLTPLEFNDFIAQWDKHRNLKGLRAQSLETRAKYELTERKLRADRFKKRRVSEKKKIKKPRPPSTGRKGRKSTVVVPEPEEEFNGWKKENNKPETLVSRIEKQISDNLDRKKTFVPILVHALGDNISMNAFDQLFGEGVLPETVIVLQYENSSTEDEETTSPLQPPTDKNTKEDSGDGTGGGNSSEVKPPMPQLSMIEKLEKGKATTSTNSENNGSESTSQTFKIHRMIVNNKDAHILAAEILQAVCPGMSPVENGILDDALEEMEEEGAEMNDDENDEEDGEEFAIGPNDPALRPGKRYLNQFGSRLDYCPVTLYEKRLLVRGNKDYCLQYEQKLYLFTSEEAMAKFERNPLRYLEIPPPQVPPRIWLVGYSRSGKKTLAKSLQEKYNVPYFAYDRKFFERCIEAARKPGGDIVEGIPISEEKGNNPYLNLAESILKDVRDFAAEQERCKKLRQEAEAEMERRAQAEQNHEEDEEEEDEEEELNEEAEARLQEQLEFESEGEEEREVRLSEAYLKIASCVTRIEPFESQGYMMVCPPFSEGDIEVMFGVGGIPEVAVQMELSTEHYRTRAMEVVAQQRAARPPKETVQTSSEEENRMKLWLEKEQRRKERELRKWRRRHIGKDDPESDPEDNSEDESPEEMNRKTTDQDNDNNDDDDDDDAIMQSIEADQTIEQEAIAEFVDAISSRFINVIQLNGDLSPNAIFRAAIRRLFKVMEHRRSLMYVAQVIRYDEAIKMLESGGANLSYFRYTDPVSLYDERHGVRRVCKWMPNGSVELSEPTEEVGLNGVNGNKRKNKDKLHEGEEEEEDEDEGEYDEEEETENSENSGNKHSQKQRPQDEKEKAMENIFPDLELSEVDEMSEIGTEEMEEVHETYERRKRREWLRKSPRVALFCGRLYFFENDADLLRYLHDPQLFVQQPPPLPEPQNKTVISVYEMIDNQRNEEGVKERTTAHHMAFNLHSYLISIPKLLSWAATHKPLLSLSQEAINAVITGIASESLITELLSHRLNGADVRSKGAVLLNLPRSSEQYNTLLERELRVEKVFQFDDIYENITKVIKSTATVDVPFSAPRNSIAALAEITRYIDVFKMNEGRAILSILRGFPMNMNNLYYTTKEIETHLSSYQWFCPYNWSLNGDLVDQSKSRCYGAVYLGNFYFFSSEEYLQRFLLHPAEITVSPGLKPLPDALPSRVPPSSTYKLELLGCCPVTLYDTRNNKGLRGVLEPLAKNGDINCIVEYKGLYYALLDEVALERFMLRPWQYVEGAQLPPPRKIPLAEGKTMSTIGEEEYMRRILYDPVARALIAVAESRPKYPGLSLEESALKFMALHMKCFNDKNTTIQAEQYKDNFEVFRKRSTLYRTMTEVSQEDAHSEKFTDLCSEWVKATDTKNDNVTPLIRLRPV
ncbi:uncharacterized protein TM35_000342200 [Trypanosoma theileri]|uniref:Cilia- and flagella-associated protein 206 n=1 Tax=Trypanosoma theileri TaxID=67003 RepID=A0A1X0NM80_9TRYP|nr:uncharacterized protein TM35_000342200 [Trypanosoma theileri]ORC85608.1 hypothetical protein TM35_000342200 [Trypanosoma theileri]